MAKKTEFGCDRAPFLIYGNHAKIDETRREALVQNSFARR